jgi:hypothetical protein
MMRRLRSVKCGAQSAEHEFTPRFALDYATVAVVPPRFVTSHFNVPAVV